MGKKEKFRIADDRLRRRLAAAQEWACAGCGADLVAGAVTVVHAAPSEGGPADLAAPVMVHESCADEQRASFPDFGDARETLGRAGDPEAAERALEAAVAVHRDAVKAVVEQATAPLQAKIDGLKTKNRKLEIQLQAKIDGLEAKNRELEIQKTELKQAVVKLGKKRQELEQRIKNCIEAVENRRLSRLDVREAVVEHLQPQRTQA